LTPLVTMMVAFPILALDDIGVELENPFALDRLNHLPLDGICESLERNLISLLHHQGQSSHGFSERLPSEGDGNRDDAGGDDVAAMR
jgi:ion channel-forming bestrophin family protein